ncbi:MAG TPA: CPBP family intramembrane glutamic endopeptidase [Methylocystis sp.]|nr:CPBP family intramembrane glutamic endopeptidase [Methylocystis sp.]
MMSDSPDPPGFWKTLRLLLGAARRRRAGRVRRQRQLLGRSVGKNAGDWNDFAFYLAVLFMLLVHGLAAGAVHLGTLEAERIEIAQHSKLSPDKCGKASQPPFSPLGKRSISAETRDCAKTPASMATGVAAAADFGAFPAMFGSLLLMLWSLMLVFQSEGMDFDAQRRRHPMWEWLFSHPAPPGAIFLGEMLTPIAANPIYLSAPAFPMILYGLVYGPGLGVAAAVLVGAPIAVAAACLGKALEIGVMLRFALRSRSAVLALMSWFGFVSLMFFMLGASQIKLLAALARDVLHPLEFLPWPWLGVFLGRLPDGRFSFASGVLVSLLGSSVVIAASIGFAVFAARRGLSTPASSADAGPRRARATFAGDPVLKKELLWFRRDRGAIVTALVIPITMAALQLFNLRSFFAQAQTVWNYYCGAAVMFGTYFLVVLGPRSLASEGSALWIALTWPQGMEALLKAKARLWSSIICVIVWIALALGAWRFPAAAGEILVIAIGWGFFARSLGDKMVTLASIVPESGETRRAPWSQQMAAWLGTLTFAVGVTTLQWSLVAAGVVYSVMTAAAMWQNFRARLPYLYDPWSERAPPAPSLMHAMVAISAVVEGGAAFGAFAIIFVGQKNVAVAQAIGFTIAAVVAAIVLAQFLKNRGVSIAALWRWRSEASPEAFEGARGLALSLALGLCAGLALGALALGYLWLLRQFPASAAILDDLAKRQAAFPQLRQATVLLAVLVAPVAEEFLFRGLLYRALDREWGGWRAVLGTAAFFAVYHPALSWAPVGLLGAMNALLFKRAGRLAPAVLAHAAYNAVVVSFS